MKVGVVGCGVVGEAVAMGLERLGHTVIRHDIKFKTQIESMVGCDIAFICVPTNMLPDGNCDTSIVEDVVSKLMKMDAFKGIVAIKSTVTPGLTQKLGELYSTFGGFNHRICFVPEFLRERSAFYDFTEGHDTLIVGTHSDAIFDKIVAAHGHYPKTISKLTPTEAELSKYFSNVYNAMRITFANGFYDVCQKLGANYTAVKNAITKRGTIKDIYLDCNDNFRGFGGYCLVEGTNVYTSKGLIPIENINIGDYVLTIDGSYQKVIEKFIRTVDEDLIKVTPQGMKSVILTKEHPVYAQHTNRKYQIINGKYKFSNASIDGIKLEWINAEDLKKGDYVCIPTPKEWNSDFGEITPSIARLLGYYTAEGSLEKNNNRISFAFHSNELLYHKDVEQIAAQELGVINISKNIDGNRCNIRFASNKFKELAKKHCGQHSWNKNLSVELLTSNKIILTEFLIGYFRGDGSKSYNDYTIATVSKKLANDLKFIYNKFGICYTYKISPARIGLDGVRHREAYYLCIRNKLDIEKFGEIIGDKIIRNNKIRKSSWLEPDGKQIIPIKSIEIIRYSGKVYNLEIDNNNTYVVEDMLVHNCLPKDGSAFANLVKNLGLKSTIFSSIIDDNKLYKTTVFNGMRK